MRLSPPENPTEDKLIGLLDRGVSLHQRAAEMNAVSEQMRQRERARLKFLLRRAKLAEAGR